MTFSIIIATYEPGAELERAITSICNQTFKDFEIVIQDNLSQDEETLLVFEKFARDISIERAPDKGIYDAFNKALKRCSGDWILFLGADDFLADEKVLEKIHAVIAPSSHLVLGCIENLDAQSRWIPRRFVSKMKWSILWKNTIHQQGCFYNREWIQSIGFSDQYKVLGDYEVHLKAFLVKAQVQHTAIFISTCDARGLSKNFTSALYDEELQMKKQTIPFLLYCINVPLILFKRWLKAH